MANIAGKGRISVRTNIPDGYYEGNVRVPIPDGYYEGGENVPFPSFPASPLIVEEANFEVLLTPEEYELSAPVVYDIVVVE